MAAVRHSSPAAAIGMLRLIGISLAVGVAVLAVVAWFVQRGATQPPVVDSVMVYVWVAFATSLAAASLVAWRGMVVPHLDAGRPAGPWQARAEKVQTGVIITWALVEAAALFGVVVYFVSGQGLPAVGGLVLMGAALALSWPRTEWLSPDPSGRR
jgi:uncharacterized protein YijF (DUF1287 family)